MIGFLERLSAIPRVQAAALVTYVPYSKFLGGGTNPFSIAGRPEDGPRRKAGGR